jgi:dTDP-4-dehydrorhamnose reductase
VFISPQEAAMRIAVLGSKGQLGRDLVPRLPGEVVPLTRTELDLANPETIAPAVDRVRPAVFVNCAAYNFVDRAESEQEEAFAANAWGLRELARVCRLAGAKLVHVSTDYVFGLDEARETPFGEDEAPGPVSVYGLSKLCGEFVVRAASPRNLVVRTCGLYGVWGSGGKGGNFVETMLRVAGQGKPLKVVADQRCTPTYTADLAAAMAELIRRDAAGLVHATSGGDCSWHEFAAEIFSQTDTAADLTPITSEQFAAAARRPKYSVLSGAKLASLGVPPLRPWRDALAAYLAERGTRS